MLVGIDAVDPVVGGHEALNLAFLHGHFKGREVNLPEGTLVNHGVVGHTPKLL